MALAQLTRHSNSLRASEATPGQKKAQRHARSNSRRGGRPGFFVLKLRETALKANSKMVSVLLANLNIRHQ